MALIVEDGTGLTTAESYVSESDAETYWNLRFPPSEWTAASVDKRERALRVATTWLDATLAQRWLGERKENDQRLAWPRTGVYDLERVSVASNAIPEALEAATAEAAAAYLVNPDDIEPGSDDASDVSEETIDFGGGTKHTRKMGSGGGGPPAIVGKVNGLLIHITRGPNEVVLG